MASPCCSFGSPPSLQISAMPLPLPMIMLITSYPLLEEVNSQPFGQSLKECLTHGRCSNICSEKIVYRLLVTHLLHYSQIWQFYFHVYKSKKSTISYLVGLDNFLLCTKPVMGPLGKQVKYKFLNISFNTTFCNRKEPALRFTDISWEDSYFKR